MGGTGGTGCLGQMVCTVACPSFRMWRRHHATAARRRAIVAHTIIPGVGEKNTAATASSFTSPTVESSGASSVDAPTRPAESTRTSAQHSAAETRKDAICTGTAHGGGVGKERRGGHSRGGGVGSIAQDYFMRNTLNAGRRATHWVASFQQAQPVELHQGTLQLVSDVATCLGSILVSARSLGSLPRITGWPTLPGERAQNTRARRRRPARMRMPCGGGSGEVGGVTGWGRRAAGEIRTGSPAGHENTCSCLHSRDDTAETSRRIETASATQQPAARGAQRPPPLVGELPCRPAPTVHDGRRGVPYRALTAAPPRWLCDGRAADKVTMGPPRRAAPRAARWGEREPFMRSSGDYRLRAPVPTTPPVKPRQHPPAPYVRLINGLYHGRALRGRAARGHNITSLPNCHPLLPTPCGLGPAPAAPRGVPDSGDCPRADHNVNVTEWGHAEGGGDSHVRAVHATPCHVSSRDGRVCCSAPAADHHHDDECVPAKALEKGRLPPPRVAPQRGGAACTGEQSTRGHANAGWGLRSRTQPPAGGTPASPHVAMSPALCRGRFRSSPPAATSSFSSFRARGCRRPRRPPRLHSGPGAGRGRTARVREFTPAPLRRCVVRRHASLCVNVRRYVVASLRSCGIALVHCCATAASCAVARRYASSCVAASLRRCVACSSPLPGRAVRGIEFDYGSCKFICRSNDISGLMFGSIT
eukprot:gene21735-biopygen46828